MLRKIALPVVALAVFLILASAPANAAVRFGITVGPPVYTYPAYPYAYPDYNYNYNNYYYAPAPRYVYPYRSWDRYRDYRDHERHERLEHEQRNFRDHRR